MTRLPDRQSFQSQLDIMWQCFRQTSRVPEDSGLIEDFVEAKDRAQELLAKIAEEES